MKRALLVLLASCNFGSGHVCTDIALYSLKVRVTDAITGAPLCGATVIASDGAFRETLQESRAYTPTGAIDGCVYTGVTERPATYAIDVTRTGYNEGGATGVVVTSDDCHVATQSVGIALAPR